MLWSVESIPSPVQGNDGLTWDGKYLWIADFNTQKAYQVDSTDGSVIMSFALPGTYPMGLAWDGSYLWVVDEADKKVYKLSK